MKKSILVLAMAVFAGASSLWAQTSRATLGGRVTDAQGSAVPNAEVSVVSEETDVKQTTRTNEQGNWVVQFLIPARYNFTISAAGFKSIEHKGIVLQTSDNKQIDSQLEVGSTTHRTHRHRGSAADRYHGRHIRHRHLAGTDSRDALEFARAHHPCHAIPWRAAAGSEQQHRPPVVARCGLPDHSGWRAQQHALQHISSSTACRTSRPAARPDSCRRPTPSRNSAS